MHTVVWAVLGALPFGEDDRAGGREVAVLGGCAVAAFVFAGLAGAARLAGTVVADGIGSIIAAAALTADVSSAPRLLWLLVPAAVATLVLVVRVEARCVLCALTGYASHHTDGRGGPGPRGQEL